MDWSIFTAADEYRREYMEALESFPFKGLKAWGAVALLFHRGFRGSYADICRELGWFAMAASIIQRLPFSLQGVAVAEINLDLAAKQATRACRCQTVVTPSV